MVQPAFVYLFLSEKKASLDQMKVPNIDFNINALIGKSMLGFRHYCTVSNDSSKPNIEIENMRPYHGVQMRIRC